MTIIDEDDDEEMYRKSSSDVIRLISSGGSAQLTVKKSLLNREVVCAKIGFMMEDVLWLLSATSDQSRDAMKLINAISDLVVSQSTSGHTSSTNAAPAANSIPIAAGKSLASQRSPSKASLTAAAVKMDTSSSLYRIFAQFAPVESSVHFNLKTFQLQIVDDMNTSNGSFHSKFPPLSSGSALLFSATGINLSLYPEYNAKRGFRQGFSEKDTSLHVRIVVSSMQLHCVGLNDSRLRARKKTEDEKNKYFMCAPVGVPDVIPAVEISLNHFYDKESDCGTERTDWVHLKLGPMRVYVDEPTLLWIHSFVLPLIIAGSSTNNEPASECKPHIETQVELTMPVIVLDQKNPFEIFPSPFNPPASQSIPTNAAATTDIAETQLEISCTKVFVQRLKGNDMAWSLKADPVWVDLVKDVPVINAAVSKKERRSELVSPFNVRGNVIIFPKTEFSVEEVRIAIEVTQVVNVSVMLSDLPDLLRMLSKLDILTDFIAQDKLEMRRCFDTMEDSLLSVRVTIPDACVSLLRLKSSDSQSSDSGSESRSEAAAQLPRSASAPEEFASVIDAPVDQLSAMNLMDSQYMNSLTGSTTAPDLLSIDSRISDEDDQYILKHIQAPASMSSSPSLLQVYDDRVEQSSTPTDSVEEAEDVSAMMADELDDALTKRRMDKEAIVSLNVRELGIEKRATDLHGVTIICIRKPIILHESLVDWSPSDTGTSDATKILIRSEIMWSGEKGKQELTSILVQDHPSFNIHAKTIEAIAASASNKQKDASKDKEEATKGISIPDNTPAVSIFLHKFACSLLHDCSHEAIFTLAFDAGLVYKDSNNVLSVEPLAAGMVNLLAQLERKHCDMFGDCSLVSGFTEQASDQVADDVMLQILTRNEELEKKLQLLQQENSSLRRMIEGSNVNHESD